MTDVDGIPVVPTACAAGHAQRGMCSQVVARAEGVLETMLGGQTKSTACQDSHKPLLPHAHPLMPCWWPQG
jgi:hypothetical protein